MKIKKPSYVISELLNSGFFFSFFILRLLSYVAPKFFFIKMHLLHPAVLLKLSFGSKWVQKTKKHSFTRMLFSNIDFNFAHFEIARRFGLIWVKLQNDRFHLQVSISGI